MLVWDPVLQGTPKASLAIQPPSHNSLDPLIQVHPDDLTQAPALDSNVGLGFLLAPPHKSPDLEFSSPKSLFLPPFPWVPSRPLGPDLTPVHGHVLLVTTS